MCFHTPTTSGIAIAPGMTQAEFDAIERPYQTDRTLALARAVEGISNFMFTTEGGNGLDIGEPWDRQASVDKVQAGIDQWIADNPERHRLGALSAAGKPTKQSARSPQGSANPQAAPAAGVGGGLEGSQADISGTGAAGAFQLGADALALSKRRKSLLGG